jgi:hypothetical protein
VSLLRKARQSEVWEGGEWPFCDLEQLIDFGACLIMGVNYFVVLKVILKVIGVNN